MAEVLGLDIGGANLKAATSQGEAITLPFPLWKQPEKLTGALIDLLLRFPPQGPIAVTMTGELCDCFPTKPAGVKHILDAVQDAARDRPLYVWRNDGKWASINHAKEDWQPVASANWLAAATFAGRYLPEGPGWFFDLGSTTFDLIPMQNGLPIPKGRTDLQRLIAGELAYLGSSRTPICAIATMLNVKSTLVTAAAELFATVDDVYLLLGLAPEDANDRTTADSQPRTKERAQARLARMVCSEVAELEDVNSLAEQIKLAHEAKLIKAIQTAFQRHSGIEHARRGVILSGSGEWLLTRLLARDATLIGPSISLSAKLGTDLSSAACAYGVAVLLAERLAK